MSNITQKESINICFENNKKNDKKILILIFVEKFKSLQS